MINDNLKDIRNNLMRGDISDAAKSCGISRAYAYKIVNGLFLKPEYAEFWRELKIKSDRNKALIQSIL